VSVGRTIPVTRTIVAQSPIQFDYVPMHKPSRTLQELEFSLFDGAPKQDANRGTPGPSASSLRSLDDSTGGKRFTVTAFPAPNYRHRTRIRKSPLYGPWPRDRVPFQANKTFVVSALKNTVPWDMRMEGLCDWETRSRDERDDMYALLRNHDSQSDGMRARVHARDRVEMRKRRELESGRLLRMGPSKGTAKVKLPIKGRRTRAVGTRAVMLKKHNVWNSSG
jgi:hypothetical protein